MNEESLKFEFEESGVHLIKIKTIFVVYNKPMRTYLMIN
jgi:hypothetical protein